jgi:hypothetical protein
MHTYIPGSAGVPFRKICGSRDLSRKQPQTRLLHLTFRLTFDDRYPTIMPDEIGRWELKVSHWINQVWDAYALLVLVDLNMIRWPRRVSPDLDLIILRSRIGIHNNHQIWSLVSKSMDRSGSQLWIGQGFGCIFLSRIWKSSFVK